VSFLVSTVSGGTYQAMKDGAGNAVSKTASQGQYIGIDPTLFRGVRYTEIVSNATEAASRTAIVISIPAK
jgi:hypothetical protein